MNPLVNEEHLILSFQEFTLRLAAAGFSLKEEMEGQMSDWRQWAFISAKRRSILAAYMITWAWSVQREYPTFHCRELGLMLAPASKLLWQAQSSEDWLPLYAGWLSRWQISGYRVGELFAVPPNDDLDPRTQAWLEEADEFGMLLMSQGKWEDRKNATETNGIISQCYLEILDRQQRRFIVRQHLDLFPELRVQRFTGHIGYVSISVHVSFINKTYKLGSHCY